MHEQDSFEIVRFLIALGHFDGELSKEEQLFICEKIKLFKLTDDQKDLIRDDVVNPKNPEEIFSLLSPRARARSFDSALALLKTDAFDSIEKALLEQLREKHLKSVDVVAAYRDVSDELKKAKRIGELQKQNNKLRIENSIWRALSHLRFK